MKIPECESLTVRNKRLNPVENDSFPIFDMQKCEHRMFLVKIIDIVE